jgi:hypothetical protein
VNVDPYNPPRLVTDMIIQKEEEGTYSASVIMEMYHHKLEQLELEPLDSHQKEMVTKLKDLMGFISRIRVVDGPVLAEIYELFRYRS